MSPHEQLTHDSLDLIQRFATGPGVAPEDAQNLADIIAATPVLVRQVNEAVRQSDLIGFRPQPPGSGFGGAYHPDDRTIALPLDILTPPDPGEAVFVLGHELQHALNDRAVVRHYDRFGQAITSLAAGADLGEGRYNYTRPLATAIGVNRWDEAAAHLAGWNALVSHAERTGLPGMLESIRDLHPVRTSDFLTSLDGWHLELRAGLRARADLTLDPTSENIEAIARRYFDRSGELAQLGPNGESDYRHLYAAHWIGAIAREHHRANPPQHFGQQKPYMIINLNLLQLDRQLLQRNGIDLGGRSAVPYADLSNHPPAFGQLSDVNAAAVGHHPTEPALDPPQTHEALQLSKISFAHLSGQPHRSTRSTPLARRPGRGTRQPFQDQQPTRST